MSTFAFPANLVTEGDRSTLVAYNVNDESPLKTVDSTHPHFDEIVAGLKSGDPDVWELFDVAKGILNKFAQVTDRVSWNGSEVLFDGDPVHNVLTEQLTRAISEGKSANYLALARFWEKLEANPEPHSREQAYDYLAAHAFQITADGDVVGFKGMRHNGNGLYESTAASQVADKPSGYVNGEALPPLQRISQRVGDVVHMPRSEVVHDPKQACRRGLHVATYDYANSYGTVGEVTFDPGHICSVPTDGGGKKVRVWKYKFVRIAAEKEAYGQSTVLSQSPETVTWAGDVGYKV